ncbi:hypothetical protein ACQEVF_25790 [Nonomuraea polychroma]|uniref:hypothetical protein n=1 Tax=Nonomuraea polychroma TaxID=46176 RepID=UPI003D906EFE
MARLLRHLDDELYVQYGGLCLYGSTDRLTFGGNIVETGTDSHRLAHTRATQQA